MKAIALSKYFEIIHPEYVYLQLVPVKSVRNYDSDRIILAIASTYKSVMQRIRRQNRKYFFQVKWKVSYYIYMEKGRVEFYFIVPRDCLTLVKDKIGETWRGITIRQVDALPIFTADCVRYGMTYRKEDALSLAADKRSNALLSSIMGTLDIMEQGDKVGILYNFVPCDQQPWRPQFDSTIDKLKTGIPIDREKTGILYGLKLLAKALVMLSEFVTDAVAEITGSGRSATRQPPQEVALSPETKRKRDSRIIRTQIVAFSQSPDPCRGYNNALSIGEAYKSITGDNELLYNRVIGHGGITKTYFPGADVLKMTAAECANMVALPGRELLEQYKGIEHIDVLETDVPSQLRRGIIRAGISTYRGSEQTAYLTNDPEYKHLALVIIGPTRSGKTTYISNIANDVVKGGQCTILFDFCGNCELSREVSRHFKNVLTLDCSDFATLQGLGYNEIDPEEPDTFLRYRNAKMMTMQLLTLINCIVDDTAPLSAKMDRYLECAALVTFMSAGAISDVFRVLQDYRHRQQFIARVPENQMENMSEYMQALTELDDYDKNGDVVGTKFHLISGIVDRINKLKQNTYMELMLKKNCSQNINLVKEIQMPQLICLRMPEAMFATESEKDIYCTYWMTKIWLALQIRKRDVENRTSVNVIVDELYQVPSCQDFIRSKLSQMAKFSAKMIISCHYLGQIKIIRNELKAANSSYIIVSGSDKDNFAELKDELAPYTVEDVLSLKRYHALCLLKYEDGYARFVTKLPTPIN